MTLQLLSSRDDAGPFRTRISPVRKWAAFLLGLCALLVLPAGEPRAAGQDIRFVRDTEIENTIRLYVKPLFDVAGLDASFVRIVLIESPVLNAFVSGGQRIFINTGLLRAADDPTQVQGVLAHEIGHITGGHLIAMRDNLAKARITQIASMLLGLPLALASGRGDAAVAVTAAGSQIATRQFLAYSRGMEQSADQAGVGFMDAARISSRGMADFFVKLQAQSRLYSADTDAYARTHPLTEDRLAFVRNHADQSPYTDVKPDPLLVAAHARMHAKLDGYLLAPETVLQRYSAESVALPDRYARTVAFMRLHRVDEALVLIDGLIAEQPQDGFFHEMRGEILRDAGRMRDAIISYRKAVEILPWAALIHARLGQTMLELDDPTMDDDTIRHLREAVRYEPWFTTAWRTLAGAYARQGDIGNAALSQAEGALRDGDMAMAKREAERAMNTLPNASPGWLRAEDISLQTNPPEDDG